MKFVIGPVVLLIIVMFAFGVGLAAAAETGREYALRHLSNLTETVSVADSGQDERSDKLNSPPAEKNERAEKISNRIFINPEFYNIPCRDYRQVLKNCLDNWLTARSEFTKNRSWTHGFDEARRRGYRLGRDREFEDVRLLQMYLDQPLIPHPKDKVYMRPLDMEFWIPNH